MENYDVVVVGGSIAGSVAARFLAMNNLKTLLVESAKTPRDKPCSAIQFNYLKSMIGTKIPREKLCSNDLKSFNLRFKMLNFTRDVFDSWLNDIAVEAGAIFRDATRCTDFKTTSKGFEVFLHPKHGSIEKVSTKYLISADG
jgi:flavin-dependent dehydrogenase